jgi:CsoR family transcriptional regulator, copper-sensing transcriptional repressor
MWTFRSPGPLGGGRDRPPRLRNTLAAYRINEEGSAMPGYSEKKEAVVNRLRRIEGQVRGVQRMVNEDSYCIDVLTQISAVTKALQAVALELLDDHLSHCVA